MNCVGMSLNILVFTKYFSQLKAELPAEVILLYSLLRELKTGIRHHVTCQVVPCKITLPKKSVKCCMTTSPFPE